MIKRRAGLQATAELVCEDLRGSDVVSVTSVAS